jgi:hypothetical protein
MSNTAIQLKKSGETGNTPTDLIPGEIAINYADGKLYYKNDVDTLKYITNQDTFGSIFVNDDLILATSPTDILHIISNNNIKLTADVPNKRYFIDLPDSIDITSNVTANVVIVNEVLYSGLATRSATPLPNLIAQFTGNTNSYVQVNAQNIDEHGSADFVVTADVGNDDTFYIDMGIQGSQATEGNLKPLDGYLYIKGNTGQQGGNLVIGTTSGTAGLETRIISGGIEDENVIVIFNSNGANIIGNLVVGGTITGPTITRIDNRLNSAYTHANAAFDKANTGTSGTFDNITLYHFPIGDYGLVSDPIMTYGGLGDITNMYDMRIEPMTYSLIEIDFGYVS